MKKFKRTLFFTALSASIALTALGAVACGEEEHTTHSWDIGIITQPATCGKDGVRMYTCDVCKETKTEPITKTGNHTWNKGAVTTEATCTAAGVTTYTCTVCNETKTEAIEAKGHTWDEGVTTATCTTDGKTTYTCTACKETKEEDAKATGHKWGEDGFCTVCEAYSGTVVTVLNADETPAAGVIVKAANEADGVLYSAVTGADGVALMVGINEKDYQIQLYNLPEGTAYEVKNVTAADEDTVSITLKSGEIAKFDSGEGEKEIKTTGAYSVTVPLDKDFFGEDITGEVPVTLTCNYYGGARYVISWKENVYPYIIYIKGDIQSDPISVDNNANYDEATETYSFTILLSYGETATIKFGGDLESYGFGHVPAEDFPYTYAFNVNVLEAPLPGSEDLPLTIKEGENTVKGLALEDGSGYYAYVNLTVNKQGDYTFTLGENTKVTYQVLDMITWQYVDVELVNGGKITHTDMWATTYNLYVVSDKEQIEIDVAFSFTPGSLDAPYELKIGDNTTRQNSTTYFTFTPETAGKYTLRSPSTITFNVYESKENAANYQTAASGSVVVFSFEAGKTYYITTAYGGTEFSFTAYNAETDSGFSKDDPKAITLNQAATYEGDAYYYKFTPAKSGYYSVTIDCTAEYGYVIMVYSDSAFTVPVKEAYEKTVIFQAEAGTTYYIKVSSYANGTVTVTESQAEEEKGKELTLDTAVTLIQGEYKNFYFFTATEDGEYTLTASQEMTNIFQTKSDYDYSAAIGSNASKYTFTATAGETYYFSFYAGDGGTVTLSKSTGEQGPTIHGTFQIGENTFTLMQNYKDSYNATLNIATAGTYTFTFTSSNTMFPNMADITITINGTEYKATAWDYQTVDIELPAGELVLEITSTFPGVEVTLTIAKKA